VVGTNIHVSYNTTSNKEHYLHSILFCIEKNAIASFNAVVVVVNAAVVGSVERNECSSDMKFTIPLAKCHRRIKQKF
jgi:hypothetical protein